MEHFAFPGNIDFTADDQGAFSCIIHQGCCVDSSSVKQCLPSVNHEQLPNANDTELLALLAQQVAANHRRGRFSIETPLENADYNSSASGSKKTTAKKRKHRLAQRRQRRQLSDHKRVQRQRQNTSITLQTKPMKRGNTDCRRFQKRRDWIRQRLKFTVKITFFDAAIGRKNYAHQQYLSNRLGTADQPLHHE